MTSPDHISAQPFVDLPASLVDELIESTSAIGNRVLEGFEDLRLNRADLRSQMEAKQILGFEGDLPNAESATVAAVDGSYAVDRLLTTDLCVCAAVGIEGLTPPHEPRVWPDPKHRTFVTEEGHDEDTATVLRAIMLGYELALACAAPHTVVMLDGTLTLPIIYFNQAFERAAQHPSQKVSERFLEESLRFLDSYEQMVTSPRSDKYYIGLPKYSTKREIGATLGWPVAYDDRGLLSILLRAGEYTKPLELEKPSSPWHLSVKGVEGKEGDRATQIAGRIEAAVSNLWTCYYRPRSWLPAIRIEMAANIAGNPQQLANVLNGLKEQCAAPGMMEPYPIYLADRMVKSVSTALPAIRQVVTQQACDLYEGDVGEVFFGLHSYRSEAGGM
ncbi:MAG TPA: DNA double-strand break repair nuclease NurA [Solirubrobacterales bacterium]|nr:DNA double-strand break repair nuclease NurA [Solirubrobacterales bacterium]